MPYELGAEKTINCSIIVKDDLTAALGIDFNVTDTFHLTLPNVRIISVATSSNDPQEYYGAEELAEKNCLEFVEESCKQSKDRPPTPGDCARGYVRGF